MSVGEAAAELQRGMDRLPTELVATAQAAFAEAQALIAPLASETSRPELQQAMAQLAHVQSELDRFQAVFAHVRTGIQGLIAALVGTSGAITSPVAQPAARDRPPLVKPSPGAPEPAASTTDQRAASLLAKLPERNATHRKTSGYWIDDEGVEHGPLVSGRDEYATAAVAKLRELGISPPMGDLVTTDHVEVN